jgi:predicted transcriptional regulator
MRQPSSLELQLLSVLWSNGASTVREVLKVMPDGKPRAYTTVLSVLQVMEKKGLVTHSRRGLAHVYRPVAGRRQVCGPLLRGLVRDVFGGRPSRMLEHLLAETRFDAAELARMRKLLEESEVAESRP